MCLAGVLLQQSEVADAVMCAAAGAWPVLGFAAMRPLPLPLPLSIGLSSLTYTRMVLAGVMLQQSEVADAAAMCAAAGAWLVLYTVPPTHSHSLPIYQPKLPTKL